MRRQSQKFIIIKCWKCFVFQIIGLIDRSGRTPPSSTKCTFHSLQTVITKIKLYFVKQFQILISSNWIFFYVFDFNPQSRHWAIKIVLLQNNYSHMIYRSL